MKKKTHVPAPSYFVSVNSPENLRKNILEASKDLLEGLARYERFKSVRQEKLESIRKLRLDLKHTATLISRLKSHLPTVEVAMPAAPKIAPRKAPEKIEKKAEAAPRKAAPKTTELEKLEAELDDIERKLGGLK